MALACGAARGARTRAGPGGPARRVSRPDDVAVQAGEETEPLPGEPANDGRLCQRGVARRDPPRRPQAEDRLFLRLPDGQRAARAERRQVDRPSADRGRGATGGALLAAMPGVRADLSAGDAPGGNRFRSRPPDLARLLGRGRCLAAVLGALQPWARGGADWPLAGSRDAPPPGQPADRWAAEGPAQARLGDPA